MNIYSTCTKQVCHSYYQLLIINLFNIVLKVNIQTNKHFDANEYFIAIGIIYNVYIHEWPEGTSTLTNGSLKERLVQMGT